MVGGIRPSAGVVLPLLPPALLHYTINRRKLQAVRKKICAKKVKMLGGCALRGTGSPCRPCSRRGACLLCRPPTVPFACFPAPYPPAPLPQRGRGSPKVYFAGGFAPGTPAFNRLRHLQNLPSRYPAGGLARLVACCPCLYLSFLPPIPPTPFPSGEGGAPKFILPGASPPAPLHLTACGTHKACQAGTRRQKSAFAAKPTGSGSL